MFMLIMRQLINRSTLTRRICKLALPELLYLAQIGGMWWRLHINQVIVDLLSSPRRESLFYCPFCVQAHIFRWE